jgi:hypothetical protein
LDCLDAMEIALDEYTNQPGSSSSSSDSGKWMDKGQMAAVQGRDGRPYLAYKRLRGYPPHGSLPGELAPHRQDLLFADRVTGRLVAVHPRGSGARKLATYNCSGTVDNCRLRTQSPNPINTSDVNLDAAHNNVIEAYNFFDRTFGLKGMDGRDTLITVLVPVQQYCVLHHRDWRSDCVR